MTFLRRRRARRDPFARYVQPSGVRVLPPEPWSPAQLSEAERLALWNEFGRRWRR